MVSSDRVIDHHPLVQRGAGNQLGDQEAVFPLVKQLHRSGHSPGWRPWIACRIRYSPYSRDLGIGSVGGVAVVRPASLTNTCSPALGTEQVGAAGIAVLDHLVEG